MRVLRACLVGLGAGALLAAGLALADPTTDYPECTRTPTPADLEGAKGAHKAATQFYERADYERAIQYWKDAYAFDCTAHGVLINIANAYEKKGDRTRAIEALETYLARSPDASDAVTIRDKIQNLRSSLKPSTSPTPTASASASAATTVAPPPRASASAPTSSAPPPAPPPQPPYGNVPWVVTGAGVVPLLAGGILTSLGQSAINDAESKCPTRQLCAKDVADKGNSGRVEATIGGVLLGLGAASVVGGLVWQYAFNLPEAAPAPGHAAPHPQVSVTPAAGPGFTGVGVSGRF